MKKFTIIIITLFMFTINANADSINKISMDIYLDEFGTAHIKEVWDVYITAGTEGYKPYYNIGNASFRDFNVSDQNNSYDFINNWPVNSSFDVKKYKNGINYLSDGLELCWGISNYGHNVYTLNYKIDGFVAQTANKQMIYWTLIPHELTSKPQQVNISIWSDKYFEFNTPVWGYGNYGGTAYVYDGKIEVNSDGMLNSHEYMTVLVEFPINMFNTNNILDESFDYYLDKAEEGSTRYEEENYSNTGWIFDIISIVVTFVIPFLLVKSAISKLNNKSYRKIISKSKFPKDLNYFRELPCNKDIYYGFFLAYEYKLMKNKNDFLGALILSWLKSGYITVEMKEKKGIFKKGEEATLIMDLAKFNNDRNKFDFLEGTMFDYMYEASVDGILESNEFSKYCSKHYTKILNWFDKVLDEEKEKCVIDNLIVKEKRNYIETNEIYEEAKKLAGLKKFLKDFSSIEDKTAMEVHLWEYYLMFAQIFGIADTVAAEFKELYPDVITDMNYNNIVFINTMSYRSVQSASSAQTRASNYSSGGGGFSSGGGGGGSFGGGSGGGGFR